MTERTHCKQPDRDVPGIKCGYPLPCPWHTATIDTTEDPPVVKIPVTSDAGLKAAARLKEIAEAFAKRGYEQPSLKVERKP